MQPHLELDAPPDELLPLAPDDTTARELAELWVDLGGGG